MDNLQKCSFRNNSLSFSLREMNFRSVNHIAVHFHRLIYICNVLNLASGHSGLLNKLINVKILFLFILFSKRKLAVFVHFYEVSLNKILLYRSQNSLTYFCRESYSKIYLFVFVEVYRIRAQLGGHEEAII